MKQLALGICFFLMTPFLWGLELSCETIHSFHDMFKDSGFGHDLNYTERAAWIVESSPGLIQLQQWPNSNAKMREVWSGEVPSRAIGQVHTHPVLASPLPSETDRSVARKLGIPVYTISRRGVWRANPDGTLVQDKGTNWFKCQ